VTDTSGANDSPAPPADAPPQHAPPEPDEQDEQDDRTVEHRVPPSGWAYGPGAGMPPATPPPSGPPVLAGSAPYGAPFGSPPPYGAPPPYGFPGPPTATLPPPGSPPPEARRGRGLGGIAVVALVTALLGGSVGGVVGYEAALRRPPGPSTGVLGQPLPPADPDAAPLAPVEAVAARVLPSVVQLQVDGATVSGEGSGIVLGADGLLLTNNHVIEAAANGGRVVALFHDGTSAPAQIVGRDPSSDLAVLRAQGVSGLTPVALGNSDSVRVGQQVVAFGAPLGLGGTVTTGIISALDRAVSVGEESGASEATVLSALQTDAAINPGNSGGPLVDMQGALIGINSAIATTGAEGGSIGVGFSIPINQAKRVAEELERTGRATRPVLGVALAGRGRATNGAVIGQVEPGGPADQAGIKANEVVTRVDDRPVTNGNELVAAIRDHAPGDRVTLTVDGRQVPVTLGGQTG
jgi:putative serine protease PepD